MCAIQVVHRLTLSVGGGRLGGGLHQLPWGKDGEDWRGRRGVELSSARRCLDGARLLPGANRSSREGEGCVGRTQVRSGASSRRRDVRSASCTLRACSLYLQRLSVAPLVLPRAPPSRRAPLPNRRSARRVDSARGVSKKCATSRSGTGLLGFTSKHRCEEQLEYRARSTGGRGDLRERADLTTPPRTVRAARDCPSWSFRRWSHSPLQ